MNYADDSKPFGVGLKQIFFDNTLHIARGDRVEIKNIRDLDHNWFGKKFFLFRQCHARSNRVFRVPTLVGVFCVEPPTKVGTLNACQLTVRATLVLLFPFFAL